MYGAQVAQRALAAAHQGHAALEAKAAEKVEDGLQRVPSGPGSLASGTDFWLGDTQVRDLTLSLECRLAPCTCAMTHASRPHLCLLCCTPVGVCVQVVLRSACPRHGSGHGAAW